MSMGAANLSASDQVELAKLEATLKAILPEQYHDGYEDVPPLSMGSATLKLGADGKVAWNEVWTTFCDLALAGGPPHRGTLLQPASPEEVRAEPEKYQQAVAEICRGILMVTGLWVQTFPAPGWIGVRCRNVGMAGWLVRAIVAENVLARHEAATLYLPAGPHFRLAKEIKNVITVIAKACHYWTDHTSPSQQDLIGLTIADTPDRKLLGPASPDDIRRDPDRYKSVVDAMTLSIRDSTGLPCLSDPYPGWIGVQCVDHRVAIWLTRVMIAENVLARREGTVVFLPANTHFGIADECKRIADGFAHAYRLRS